MPNRASTSASSPGPQRDARPSSYPEPVDRLIAELARLPGIGRRSAERVALFLLKAETPAALALAQAIRDVKEKVRHCRLCYNLADGDLCAICADPRRQRGTVLIVEQPRDLLALEQTGIYKGLYHVLMGRLSPLDGVHASDITIAALLERIDHPDRQGWPEPIREIIMGLNPTLEGDGTALFLADQLKTRPVTVTRLARGLPTGSTLEYANKAVLADAIQGRQSM